MEKRTQALCGGCFAFALGVQKFVYMYHVDVDTKCYILVVVVWFCQERLAHLYSSRGLPTGISVS